MWFQSKKRSFKNVINHGIKISQSTLKTTLKCVLTKTIQFLQSTFSFCAIEVFHAVLEFVTLAGDTGEGPVGLAIGVSGLTYYANGPIIFVMAVCMVTVMSLKFIEDGTPRGSPSTPKKLIQRSLEDYSPLSKTPASETGDDFVESLISFKRVRSFMMLLGVLYMLTMLQG